MINVFNEELGEEFEALVETEGPEAAVGYIVSKNCLSLLAEGGHDDWIIEVIRAARESLTEEGRARLEETGL